MHHALKIQIAEDAEDREGSDTKHDTKRTSKDVFEEIPLSKSGFNKVLNVKAPLTTNTSRQTLDVDQVPKQRRSQRNFTVSSMGVGKDLNIRISHEIFFSRINQRDVKEDFEIGKIIGEGQKASNSRFLW